MTDTSMAATDLFSGSYQDARASFLDAAAEASAEIQSFQHPTATDTDGSALHIDTAWVGPRDAKSVMVMISGTHGPESYTGAAIQLAWLRAHKGFASSSMAMLLIHGANPYGWAHGSRTTENNVDLNRNFIDHAHPPEPSPLTEPVQTLLSHANASGPRFGKIVFEFLKMTLRVGMKRMVNTISDGQYTHAQGIGYGGNSAEWSNQVICDVLTSQLHQAHQVSIIDWHTGIGDYGKPCFLCFDDPESEAWQRALQWWGSGVEQSSASYSSGERPDYQGLLINAARDIAQSLNARTTSAVIEFGTYPNHKMLKGLLIDRWLRFDANDASAETRARLQQQMLQLFYPDDQQWREGVLRSAAQIIEQSLAGLEAMGHSA